MLNVVLMKSFLTFLSFQPKMFSGFRVILDHQRDHFCHPLNHLDAKATGGGFLRVEHHQLF